MKIREARCSDWPAIDALIKRARFTSPPLWRWEAHLSDRGFLVAEVEGCLEGALLATSDASPAGWVRLAAAGPCLAIDQWLDLSLPPLLSHLRSLQVHQLDWMDHGGWAGPYLEPRGFAQLTDVITLTKTDRAVPQLDAPPVRLRPALGDDFPTLSSIDRRAFTPSWWRSTASMRRRATTVSHFTVAELGGKPIGYTERQLCPPAGHLNRIAVDPSHQRQGIGALLLKHALISMWGGGAETVSLNTQRSNLRSRRLYERFGFAATGDAVTVWARPL